MFLTSCYGSQALVLGQDISSGSAVGFQSHVGKLIKIHGTYPPNDISYTQRFDLDFVANPDSGWSYLHGRAITGFSINHSTFGNELILGRAFSLAYHVYLHRPLTRKVRVFFSPSGGAAWFNKPYDIVDNPGNLVVGSAVTAMATALGGFDFSIGEYWQLRFGGSFYHYSNSHIAVPNVGANVFGGFIGLKYSPQGLPEPMNRAERATKKLKPTNWRPMVRLRLGLHEFPGTITPRDGPLYKVLGATVGMATTSESRAMWTFGVTYDYYQGYATYIVSQQLFDDVSNVDWLSSTIAVFGGREWCFGRMHTLAELSLKVHSPVQKALKGVWDLPSSTSYGPYIDARIGFRYYLIPKGKKWHEMQGAPNIGVAIKTNGGAADFLEISLGYTL